MLKQRVVTAILLAFSVVLSIFYLPSSLFSLFIALIVLISAWEWSRIAGWQTLSAQFLYVLFIMLSVIGLYFLSPYVLWQQIVLWLAVLWWSLAVLWIMAFQRGHALPWLSNRWLKSLLGLFILLPAWLSLTLLHQQYSGIWVLFLLLLIAVADIGAFFSGRRWGQRKLASRVSPGKSWEGVLGALVSSLLFAGLYSLWQMQAVDARIGLILLSLLTVAVSISGDLLESLFKRQMNMKDSSHLLPGHGGVLDRIDSITAAAPIFLLGLQYLIPGEHL